MMKRNLGTAASLAIVALTIAATPAPKHAQPAHPDIAGTWFTTGDFESAEAAFPAGGDSVGWAPVSRGAAEYRLAHMPSKAERYAATKRMMDSLRKIAGADEATRVGDPAATPLPAATAEGAKAYQDLNKTVNIRYQNERCFAGNVVSGVPSPNFVAASAPGRITLIYDSGFSRVIYMDGRDDTNGFAGMFGYSVGHWDGNVLVIKTTKISGRYLFAGLRTGWPMSENIALTEYLRVSPDGKTMTIRRVFSDPVYYTEPMEEASHLEKRNDDIVISPCVEFLAESPFMTQSPETPVLPKK